MPRCNAVISIKSRTTYGTHLLEHRGLAEVAGLAGGEVAVAALLGLRDIQLVGRIVAYDHTLLLSFRGRHMRIPKHRFCYCCKKKNQQFCEILWGRNDGGTYGIMVKTIALPIRAGHGENTRRKKNEHN